MIPGSAPTHTCTLPFDVSIIDKMILVYAQNDKEVVRKTKDDCELSGNVITVKLTQKETLRFNPRHKIEIQIKALTVGGDPLPSKIVTIDCEKSLITEVLE